MANNYLGHEERVKFYENYLNRSKEWQFFVDLIQEKFEINDINSFDEFLTQKPIISKVFSYFVNIVECTPNNIEFKNFIFQEVFVIVDFYLGKRDKNEIDDIISSNFAKALFLIVWITKLENQDNETEYLFDLSLLTQKNMSLLLKMDSLCLYEEEILQFFETINIEKLDEIKRIFSDNVNSIVYPADTTFLESCRDKIIQVDAFDFNRIERPANITWEENYILDMLSISFEDRKIIPLFSSGDSTTPDYKQWTEKRLEEMQKYFSNDISDFIIESVRYMMFGAMPSKTTIDRHIGLFIENYDNSTTVVEKYNNSSFNIIACLVEDKYLNSSKVKDFFLKLSSIEDIDEIMTLDRHKISLTKKQRRILKEYYQSCFTYLDSISDVYSYSKYLLDKDNVKSINNKYLVKNSQMFDKYIISSDDILCASLFINYMLFLTRLNGNSNIDKEYIKYEMIRIQELWEKQYYDFCVSKLHSISHEIEMKTEVIELFNKNVLDNIFSLANICVITQTQQYIENMESISSNPLSAMIGRVSLDKTFPIDEKLTFDIEKHDVDRLTTTIIENIKKDYGYRFLNILDTEKYVKEFHRRMTQNARFAFGFFNKTKELYDIVRKKLKDDFTLIDYEENIQLAHLTQLFPIIEIMIKKIGKIYNIFPFKEDEKHFMQSKDPSSILRLILEKAYLETQSFEVVPDLLFIYHYMYNGNSLNIRNECIHGREYLSGESMFFAFKVSLSALYMLIRRLEIIISSIENAKEEVEN